MNSLVRLELRKQRLAFIGLAAAFAASVPLAAGGAGLSGISAADATSSVLLFWTLLGLPCLAVVFGASAAAGLRVEPAWSAEEVLPASDGRRAAAALLAAGAYLGLLTLLVLGTSLAVSPEWRATFVEHVWGPPDFLRAALRLLGFILAELLLASFVCAYLLGSGVAGGVLGAAVGGVPGAALALGFGLQAVFSLRGQAPFGWNGALAAALCLAAGACGLAVCADWAGRRARAGWLRPALAAAALLAAAVFAFGALYRTASTLAWRPMLIDEEEDYLQRQASQRLARQALGAARRSAGAALVDDYAGDLFWLTPDGRRTALLPAEPGPFWKSLLSPYFRRVRSVAWGPDGSLWVMTAARRGGWSDCALWNGRPPQALKLRLAIPAGHKPAGLVFRGRELGVTAWRDPNNEYAPLPARGGRLLWQDMGKDDERFLLEGWRGQGLLADAAGTGRRGKPARPLSATLVAGEPWFLRTVWSGRGSSLRVVRPDGRVSRVWPAGANAQHWLSPLPDGSHWGARDRYSLHVLTARGEFLRPLFLWPALQALPLGKEGPAGYPQVLRLSQGSLWAVAEDEYLIQVDARTGGLQAHWRLPDSANRGNYIWRVGAEGFFLDTGRGLYFMGWDGSRRKLG